MNSIYVFPHTDKLNNPYIKNLIRGLKKDYIIQNENEYLKFGVLDLIINISKTDIYFLNWIEALPDRKFGIIQSLILPLFLLLVKITNKKIVWVLHNKIAHNKNQFLLKKLLFVLMLFSSDVVFTHSKEGIKYAGSLVKNVSDKIVYIPHPVDNKLIKEQSQKSIDILIWGNLERYKGIHEYLEFHNQTNLTYKVLIVGRTSDHDYLKTLKSYESDKIKIQNQFLSFEELKTLIGKSKAVLFTYNSNTVLSSGVLADTISLGGKIIGPSFGAFKDLENEGLSFTYSNFAEIPELLTKITKTSNFDLLEKIEYYIQNNDWNCFSNKVSVSLSKLT